MTDDTPAPDLTTPPTPEELHAARASLAASVWALCAIVEAHAESLDDFDAAGDDDEDADPDAMEEIAEMLARVAHYVEDEDRSLADVLDEADEVDGEAQWIANLPVPGARDAVGTYEAAMMAARALLDRVPATPTPA